MSWESASSQLWDKIRRIRHFSFEEVALEVFQYQARHNPLYAKYLELLQVDPTQLTTLEAIPFLPIQFFKNYSVQSGSWEAQRVFSSSGTTGTISSAHLVRTTERYLENTIRGFEYFYGHPRDFCFLALLPAYLEREGSSLVLMAEYFIQQSTYEQSGFYLYNQEELISQLQYCVREKIPTVLLGVSFALWDLAEQFPTDLSEVIIMETGGMKGRRREITRNELHRLFKAAFHSNAIHSEYGMTELFSQAYSKGGGRFFPAPTMKMLGREVTDPFSRVNYGRTGAIDIIDLANLDTISFIATDDLGKIYSDGSFEILGRMDSSDVRGCNLMVYG